jgi:hemoglobin
MADTPIPTLSQWAGGPTAFTKLFEEFYARVPTDPMLAPIFQQMNIHHAEHVAAFVGQVFGGADNYTQHGGSHASMIRKHLNRHLTDDQRKRWIALLLECADDVGLPADPEFRAAFVGYLEWGTRLAVINSQDGVEAPDDGLAMPVWGWGPPCGPYVK